MIGWRHLGFPLISEESELRQAEFADGEAEHGNELAAMVATREEVTTEQLRQFLHTRLPDWQIPREWRLVETLAANARGKLSRAEWRSGWVAR